MVKVEVVFADINNQEIISLNVADDTTVQQAITQSGILKLFPTIDLTTMPVGIFSKPVALNTQLQAGDRVEIYRPLMIDPKSRRRLKAT